MSNVFLRLCKDTTFISITKNLLLFFSQKANKASFFFLLDKKQAFLQLSVELLNKV